MTAANAMSAAAGPSDGVLDWASILARHDRWLRAVVMARLGERQAIDEVMQEICLAAIQKTATLADPNKVAAWLYRIAVRTTLIHRRKAGRRRKFETRYAAVREATEGGRPAMPEPLAWVLKDEKLEAVRSAIGRLAHRDAEILLLKYGENWSYRELAEHLGAGESAIEARLFRARRRLREILADSDWNEI